MVGTQTERASEVGDGESGHGVGRPIQSDPAPLRPGQGQGDNQRVDGDRVETFRGLTAGRFFLPGPTEVHPEVLGALSQPVINHRGPTMEALFARLQSGLRDVLSAPGPVVIATSSATGLMEAGVRTTGVQRVLCLVNGAFSARFANIADLSGLEVHRLEIPWGQAHDPQRVAEAVRRVAPGLLTVVHSETSTGVLNPVGDLLAAAHRVDPDVLTVVDSVSSAGGVAVDPVGWGADLLLTGAQKAMALPPGLAFGVVSERMVQRVRECETRGFYFDLSDLVDQAMRHRPPTTPAVNLLYALDVQLQRIASEGMVGRIDRHLEMARQVQAWADKLARRNGGCRIQAVRCPTVTTIVVPQEKGAGRVVETMASRGYVIGTGYGPMRDSAIRIGHMGDHTLEGIEGLLRELTKAMPT